MAVYPVATPGLGEALLGGVQNFMQARRQKQAQDQQDELFHARLSDALYDQASKRADDEIHGKHVLAPGETIPLSVSQNIVSQAPPLASPTTDELMPSNFRDMIAGMGATGGQPSGPANGPAQAGVRPSRASAGALNIPGHPAAQTSGPTPGGDVQAGADATFRNIMAQMGGGALGGAPAPLPRYEFGNGWYLDRQPQQQAAATARAQHMQDLLEPALIAAFTKQQNRAQMVDRYVRAGVPADRAELYADNPALAQNDPKVGKPTPDPVAIHRQEREFDIKNPLPQPPATNVYLPTLDPKTGQTVYSVVPNKGPVTPGNTGLIKPQTATGTKQAQASNKEKSYVALMGQSLPTMQALAGKVRPDRISAAIAHPMAGNVGLNPDEQAYLQAARNFLAGVLHEESGARLSKEQWDIGVQRFIPTVGDTPATVHAKLMAAQQLYEDRQGLVGAGADSTAAATGKTIMVNGKAFKVPN